MEVYCVLCIVEVIWLMRYLSCLMKNSINIDAYIIGRVIIIQVQVEMGQGMFATGMKNIKQTYKAMRTSSQSYTFTQRKGDRLVGVFLISCFANIQILHLTSEKENQICENYAMYMDQLRKADHHPTEQTIL